MNFEQVRQRETVTGPLLFVEDLLTSIRQIVRDEIRAAMKTEEAREDLSKTTATADGSSARRGLVKYVWRALRSMRS